jgi:hypothetical protein
MTPLPGVFAEPSYTTRESRGSYHDEGMQGHGGDGVRLVNSFPDAADPGVRSAAVPAIAIVVASAMPSALGISARYRPVALQLGRGMRRPTMLDFIIMTPVYERRFHSDIIPPLQQMLRYLEKNSAVAINRFKT